MAIRIQPDAHAIREFCSRWKVTELSLFGSVLRDDFGPDSDVDVLVSFAPDAHWSSFDLVDMEEELEGLFGERLWLLVTEHLPDLIRRLEPLVPAAPEP